MADTKHLEIDRETHRRLKAFAAYERPGMILGTVVADAINDYIDRQTRPDFRHVAAASDKIEGCNP